MGTKSQKTQISSNLSYFPIFPPKNSLFFPRWSSTSGSPEAAPSGSAWPRPALRRSSRLDAESECAPTSTAFVTLRKLSVGAGWLMMGGEVREEKWRVGGVGVGKNMCWRIVRVTSLTGFVDQLELTFSSANTDALAARPCHHAVGYLLSLAVW